MTGPETGAGPGAGEARGAGARGVDAPGTGGAPGHGGPGGGPVREPVTPAELAVVAAQLGRRPRGTRAVAHRCP